MPRQSSGDSAREIEELVAATDALYFAMRRGRTSPAGTQAGMSRSQLELLAPLLDQESMSVSRLAGTAGDDLLVLGGLPPGGRARVIKAQSAFRARQQEVFEELSVADRRAMTDSLTRLAALINDNMDARA